MCIGQILSDHTVIVKRGSLDGSPVTGVYIYSWCKGQFLWLSCLLSSEALESLRLFCLESTVWTGNRYAHGRLGAFFQDGFNCPLLLQIAEELLFQLVPINEH